MVNKSLLSMSSTGAVARYRMLETTRAYALEKLVERGELQRYARRHAQYHLVAFRLAAAEWKTRSVAEWLSDYTPLMGDGRAALDWACSADGDPTLGAELTIALSPLWSEVALMEEWWNNSVTHALRTEITDPQPPFAQWPVPRVPVDAWSGLSAHAVDPAYIVSRSVRPRNLTWQSSAEK